MGSKPFFFQSLTLVALILMFSGCQRGESEAFASAREAEQKLLMKGGALDYSDPGYLVVARELNDVAPWSSDYAAAQEKLSKIKAARRLKLNETHGLSYTPKALEGVALASLAPELLDRVSRPVPAKPAPAPVLPSSSAGSADSVSAGSSASNAARTAQAEEQPAVILYSTSWCGYCRKARAFLKQRNVAYVEKDVERDPVAGQEATRKTGGYGGVPVLDIGGTIIHGFDVPAIERALAEQARRRG